MMARRAHEQRRADLVLELTDSGRLSARPAPTPRTTEAFEKLRASATVDESSAGCEKLHSVSPVVAVCCAIAVAGHTDPA